MYPNINKVTTAWEAASVLSDHQHLGGTSWTVVWTGNVSSENDDGETITMLPDDAVTIANTLNGYYDQLESQLQESREALRAARPMFIELWEIVANNCGPEWSGSCHAVVRKIDAALKEK